MAGAGMVELAQVQLVAGAAVRHAPSTHKAPLRATGALRETIVCWATGEVAAARQLTTATAHDGC